MKWIFITGCSTGLGEECAIALAKANFHIFATVRDKKHLPEWFQKLSDLEKEKIYFLELDLLTPLSLILAVQEAKEVLRKSQGKMYGLINNAGICITGPLELLPEDQLLLQMRVNWLGPILLTQNLLPLLRESRGHIINIGSAAGSIAMPFLSAYASSKFAMEAWTDSLRREISPQGIRVTLLQVGSISTPIWKKLEENALQNLQTANAEQTGHYAGSLKTFLALNRTETGKRKTKASDVARIVVTLFGKSSAPTRVKIGADAKINSLVTKLIPDKWLDFFFSQMIRPKGEVDGTKT